MKRLNIAFDLDNTLIDFSTLFNHVAKIFFNADCTDPSSYNYEISHGLTAEQRIQCLRGTYACTLETPILPGAKEFLTRLWRKSRSPITIITARPIEVATETHKLIQAKLCYNIPYTLAFSGTSNKFSFLHGYKYYVEDHPDIAWTLATQTKMRVFLIDQPYNRSVEHGHILHIPGIGDLLHYPISTFIEEV